MKSEPVSNLLKCISVSTPVLLPLKDAEALLLLRGAHTHRAKLTGVAANHRVMGVDIEGI